MNVFHIKLSYVMVIKKFGNICKDINSGCFRVVEFVCV